MVAGTEGGRDLGPGPHRAHRDAVAERLGHGHDVGLGPGVLVAEPPTGSSQSGLDLVQYQQDAALVAYLAHCLQVAVAGRHDAALALHRLQQHRAHRGVERGHEGVDVVEGHVTEAVGHGREGLMLLGLAGGGQRGQRAAVERSVGGHHRVAAPPGVLASQLEGGLHRLRAGVLEQDPARFGVAAGPGPDQPVECLHDLGRRLVGEQVGGVDQRRRLGGDGLGHRRVGVAQPGDGQAAQEVEVAPAAVVPQLGSLAPHEGHRRGPVVVHQGGPAHGWSSVLSVLAVIIVPIPASVNSSSSTAWGIRPSSMWAEPAPARTASMQA